MGLTEEWRWQKKERVHELEERSVEIIQSEKVENKDHKFEEGLKYLWAVSKSLTQL